MAHLSRSVKEAGRRTEQVSRPWLERLYRAGFAAKGILYLIIGILAVQVARGRESEPTTSSGALRAIAERPLGSFLLASVTLGLFGYALWRGIQAIFDLDGKGTDAKGLGKRATYLISGALYAGLTYSAIRILTATERTDGSQMEESLTARVLGQPFGRWLMALVSLGVIGAGLYQLYQAYSAKFREKLRIGEMRDTEETWAMRMGRFGLAARGIVFGIAGTFLLQAVLRFDPERAAGIDEALMALTQQPFGPALLGVVALGLTAYGAYMLILVRFGRIGTN